MTLLLALACHRDPEIECRPDLPLEATYVVTASDLPELLGAMVRIEHVDGAPGLGVQLIIEPADPECPPVLFDVY